MRRRLSLVIAMPAAVAVLGLSAAPAFAGQAYPTTPIPPPASAGQPPASAPNGPQPLGHAVGDAGAGLAVLRLLPNSVTTKTILPGAGDAVPKQSEGELGFGLSSAQVNSESYLNYEHSIAQSAPMGIAYQGSSPQLPGALTQTAPPDNAKPITGGLDGPKNPILNIGALDGSVHARWSDTLGPCVGTISDASTSVASVGLLNTIPNLGALSNLTDPSKIFDLSKLNKAQQQAVTTDPTQLTKPLSMLGGLLSGQSSGDGALGSLVSLPNVLSSHSFVRLVDIPGSKNKAVQSVSTLQVASVKILAGTPMEIDLNVVSQPTLTVTSTGDAKTSSVNYTAPVIQVVQHKQTLFTLDAAHPTQNMPLALPLPGLPVKSADLKGLPLVGNMLSFLKPGANPKDTSTLTLPLGVIQLSIAQEKQQAQALVAGKSGAPFTGYQVGATTRMVDLQVLPTTLLKMPNLPSALAEISLGEQVARAYAPQGGVVCGTAAGATPPGKPKPQASPPLAYTAAAYHAVPLFWSGTGFLLAGAILVALTAPRRRRS